jgi:hypothetical protein
MCKVSTQSHITMLGDMNQSLRYIIQLMFMKCFAEQVDIKDVDNDELVIVRNPVVTNRRP